MWRDWFTFSRQDRRAIILFSAMIVVALGVLCIRSKRTTAVTVTTETDSIASTLLNPKKEAPIVKIDRHNFNPNKADSMELLTMGLSPYATRNILRYRRAGGVFRRSEDLARIYGMHDTVYAQLKPYITIPQEKEKKVQTVPTKASPQEEKPSAPRKEHPYAEYMRAKNKPGQLVDVNTADTTELMKIPGIGPVYANMIVNYRQQLGGFHHVGQLRELNGLPEQLGNWVYIDTPTVEKLRINKLSVTRLRSHPYLTFYQAKAIVELRQREGNIKSARQLLFLDEFTEADIERLAPYLSFE